MPGDTIKCNISCRNEAIDIELVPVFQPIVDIAGGVKPIGYEALIRGRGILRLRGAREVFERASEFGGSKALDQRIRDLEIETGIPLLDESQRMFLNMPTHALQDSSWLVLRSVASNLVLEVSEHSRLSDADIEWLLDFREHGMKLAIDDFGVGQTNLHMLSLLRPDYLKLDLSFVRQGDFETVKRVRRLSEDWDARLIVEGVETVWEAGKTMDAGARYIQGFLYGKPREAWRWMDNRRWSNLNQALPP